MMKYKFPAIIPAVFDRVHNKFLCLWSVIKTPVLCWLWGVKRGKGVRFQGNTVIRSHGRGDIVIGKGTKFNSIPETNTVGLIGSTTIDNRSGGNISIGANCGFSSVVISSKIGIKIGNRVMVGGNARIFDHDFHSLRHDIRWTRGDAADDRAKLVTIDDDCFIGTNAVILKGTHLGARSIVAAGSVVFGLNVPPDSIVKGNPARVTSQKKV